MQNTVKLYSKQRNHFFQLSLGGFLLGISFILITYFLSIKIVKVSGYVYLGTLFALINIFYSNKAKYKKWTLTDSQFLVKEFLSTKPKTYNYEDVSSYRIIYVSGANERNHNLYKELHIWFKNKDKMSIYRSDYLNFDEMMDVFIEKMDKFDIDSV